MKYEEIRGDVFAVHEERAFGEPARLLVHCISADFALGAGIAKEIDRRYGTRETLKRMYPGYLDSYRLLERKGDCLRSYEVLNLVTKERFWMKPTYDTMRAALTALRDLFDPYKPTVRLVMPKIGCGLDRLEWPKVRQLIYDVFDGYDFDIIVCSL